MLGVGRRLARGQERSSGHGGGSGGRWLVSYADFVTLMFGFFLILWASASQDPVKFQELAEGFHKAFNSGAMLGQPNSGQILGKGGRLAPNEVSSFQRVSETVGELVAQLNLADQLGIGMRREGLVITFSSTLAFEPGTSDLSPRAKDVLARLAPSLDGAPGQIRVEGHTDNVPIQTADFPSNWELSNARAGSVTRFLSETMGIPGDKFEIAGYAEYRPLVPNDTRENRSKNRRVEIVLMAPSQEGATPVPLPPPVFSIAPSEAPAKQPAAPSEAPARAPAKPAAEKH
jgi:chemotaxis protein MotB